MKVDFTPDEIRMLLEEVSHYNAYLHSLQRQSDDYTNVQRSLQRLLK